MTVRQQQTATKGARWTENGNGKDFWKQHGEQGLYLGRQGQSCIPDESRSEATHGGGTHACCD